MMHLVIEVNSESKEIAELTAGAIRHWLEGIVNINRMALRSGEVPLLYESDVIYQDEPDDYESIVDAVTTYDRGHGDCAHLAAWRVAELREMGENASLTIQWAPSNEKPGVRLYHVQVRRADGSIEDPSAILGMNGF